jgi:hydroxypyruvate isomerase
MRFAANLTMMFNEVGFLERFEAAAKAGFSGVEYLFPYAYPAAQISELLAQNGLTQALFNLPAGDWAAGERGIACHPDRVSEFREGVGKAIEYARILGCGRINCLAGITQAGVTEARSHETLVENATFAAGELEAHGIRLLIEPINTRDIPGFFLTRTAQALEVIAETGSKNVGLQYDVYHMQIMEGDLACTIEKNLGVIGHIQIADNPGRHEPGTGEIHYPFLFRHLDRLGYAGWIGCEYRPAGNTEAGLTWLRPYLTT